MNTNCPPTPTAARPPRILISGGGTGGHIFPAISIANAIRRAHPDAEILFAGAEGRMEMERVPDAGYDIVGLPVAGFDRRRIWRNVAVLWRLWVSMRRARRVLDDFKPDIAVGVGGYASGPVLKEAQRRGIPTLLQEQNSYAGVTNRLLGSKARAICVAYEGMEKFFPADRIVLTGNPVRKELADAAAGSQADARRALGFDPGRKLLVVVGGSLGARTINQSIGRALPQITATGTQVLWQTGRYYYDEYARFDSPADGVRVMPFIADMGLAYRGADLIVSRAGAATISEIELLGLAAVLVPSPNVAEDHQTHNARALADRGAAVLLPDADAPERMGDTVTELMADDAARSAMSAKAFAMRQPDSDNRIVDCIDSILNQTCIEK